MSCRVVSCHTHPEEEVVAALDRPARRVAVGEGAVRLELAEGERARQLPDLHTRWSDDLSHEDDDASSAAGGGRRTVVGRREVVARS